MMSKKYLRGAFRLLILSMIFSAFFALQTNAQGRRTPVTVSPTPPSVEQTDKNSDKKDKKKDKNKKSEQTEVKVDPAYGPEITIPEIGIKIKDLNYRIEDAYDAEYRAKQCAANPSIPRDLCLTPVKRLPVVTAVQVGSPAYFLGVVPGDFIRHTPNYVKDAALLAAEIERQYRNRYASYDLIFYFFASDSPYPHWREVKFSFDFNDSRNGEWITEIPVHASKDKRSLLKGVGDGREALKTVFENVKKEAFRYIAAYPCDLPLEKINSMAREVNNAGEKSGAQGDYYDFGTWQEQFIYTGKVLCEVAQQGELSQVESAIVTIFEGKLQPCDYSASNNYRFNFREKIDVPIFRYAARTYLKSTYAKDFDWRYDLYLKRAPSDQRACFINLLKSSLTGAR